MKNYGYLALMLTLAVPICARTYKVSSEDRFYDALSRQELAIVMFYHESKADRDKNMRRAKENFRSASKNEPYVAFIDANVDKDDLMSIAREYNVQQFPAYILFRQHYRNKGSKTTQAPARNQMVAKTTGYLSKYTIINFIEDHFSEDIDKILKFKREQAERRAEQARINASYWWPYGGWGYPYYGYGFGRPYYGYYW